MSPYYIKSVRNKNDLEIIVVVANSDTKEEKEIILSAFTLWTADFHKEG